MNKPITMVIKETKMNLVKVCNESGLSPVILDLIVQGLYSEIHAISEKQTEKDEQDYMSALAIENMKNIKIVDENSKNIDE